MTTLMQRLRNRRTAIRRADEIERAIRNAHSPALRRELMEISTRLN
jgi:hypothetical protein